MQLGTMSNNTGIEATMLKGANNTGYNQTINNVRKEVSEGVNLLLWLLGGDKDNKTSIN
ncbi:MAG: hypothetical protein WC850_06605 [Candidatus Gracilibacteria bacterium]